MRRLFVWSSIGKTLAHELIEQSPFLLIHLDELDSKVGPLRPTNRCQFNRDGLLEAREKHPEFYVLALFDGEGALDQTARHSEIEDSSFPYKGAYGDHDWRCDLNTFPISSVHMGSSSRLVHSRVFMSLLSCKAKTRWALHA